MQFQYVTVLGFGCNPKSRFDRRKRRNDHPEAGPEMPAFSRHHPEKSRLPDPVASSRERSASASFFTKIVRRIELEGSMYVLYNG